MDWFGQMSLLDFLRGTGKHARVQTMLARDRCVAPPSLAGLAALHFA